MSTFDYRRRLDRSDWMKLLGAAGGAGLGLAAVITYVGRLWMQRVPLPRGGDPVPDVGNRDRVRTVEPRRSRPEPKRR